MSFAPVRAEGWATRSTHLIYHGQCLPGLWQMHSDQKHQVKSIARVFPILPSTICPCGGQGVGAQRLPTVAGHDADVHAGLQEHKAELQASDPQLQLAPLEDVFLTVVRKAELENSQERGQVMRLVVSEEHLVLKVRRVTTLYAMVTSAHDCMTPRR